MSDLLSPAEKPVSAHVTTAAVMVALRTKYCAPEYALFENVGNSGSRSSVYADGVAMNMWASRGYALTGFEVKASRSDWLRELKQPEKSEPILTRCDFWYLVAPDEVFKIDEVPISWGILALKGGKLHERRKAPKLEPKPVTREFVAQMFRRYSEQEQRDITALVDKEMAKSREELAARIRTEVDRQTRQLRQESDKWKRFCEMIDQSEWTPEEDVARAVNVVLKAGVAGTYGSLPDLLRTLKNVTTRVEEAVNLIPSSVPSYSRGGL